MANRWKYTIYLPFRFRKIKQQNAEYFQRSGEKRVTEHTNTVLDPDYLDAMVFTSRTQNRICAPFIQGCKNASWKAWQAIGLLEPAHPPQLTRRRSRPTKGYRQGVEPYLRDGTFHFLNCWPLEWFTLQVIVLGIPEMADVVGGQISARGPST